MEKRNKTSNMDQKTRGKKMKLEQIEINKIKPNPFQPRQ